ncbi:MAG: hypothetical protein RIR84_565 [Bacteroidota bacterium]|jgi:uncharacterized membrane protein YgdD (TMEM256/DUF423 family)
MFKNHFATGSIFCGIAVVLGAFGAHALKAILSPESLQSFQTAVQYQMLHGMAILIVGLISERVPNKNLGPVTQFFSVGILLFSGSIYMLAYLKYQSIDFPPMIALITPIGGLCMIIGWFSLSWTFLRR